MSAEITVVDVSVLPNGKTLIVGEVGGGNILSGTKLSTLSGEIELEVLAVAIVDPVERPSSNKLFHVRILKGGSSDDLKGKVLLTK